MKDKINAEIDIEKIVNHWLETSEEDFVVMNNMFETKSYSWSLFLGHITIEKILKAYYVKKHKKHAPLTHNLLKLAELNEFYEKDEYLIWLDIITSFNLNARYDDYKRNFYATCTKEFTMDWIEKIKILRLWIKEML